MKTVKLKTRGIFALAVLTPAGVVVLIGILLLQVLSGCSSSTDPAPGADPPPTFAFSPNGQGQTVNLSETMVFSVTSNSTSALSVKWYREGLVVGQETLFTYVPTEAGRDTLAVSTAVGSVTDDYYWVITVQDDVLIVPPVVKGVAVEAGPEPADVIVSWPWVSKSTYPLVEYLVASSYDGPIDGDNWDQATILERVVSVPGQLRYQVTFTETLNGMMPGERAWFAVRVADDRQQLSPLEGSIPHDITWPWYLGGFVYDDAGLLLPEIILRSGVGGQSSNSDADGWFLFDKPFRNIDVVRIDTNSASWYGFVTPPVSVDQDTTLFDITLITRYGLDAACYGNDFLDYLRDITWTWEGSGITNDSKLMKWEQYPISVYIPAGLNEAGIDMEQPCQDALDFWNSTMANDASGLGIAETDYFVRTTDQATADIDFVFKNLIGKYGEISLILPGGLDDDLGAVVPQKMEIRISTSSYLALPSRIQSVALHEFGHTLGILGHFDCSDTDYLMSIGGGISAMDRPEPIHLDERRVVRTIRNLPQETRMSDYSQ